MRDSGGKDTRGNCGQKKKRYQRKEKWLQINGWKMSYSEQWATSESENWASLFRLSSNTEQREEVKNTDILMGQTRSK